MCAGALIVAKEVWQDNRSQRLEYLTVGSRMKEMSNKTPREPLKSPGYGKWRVNVKPGIQCTARLEQVAQMSMVSGLGGTSAFSFKASKTSKRWGQPIVCLQGHVD